jgi:hypothetical protein
MRAMSLLMITTILLVPLAGCTGDDSEIDDSISPSLINLSGSVEHSFCKLGPGEGTQVSNSTSNQSDNCPVNDETIADYWSAISNLTAINQTNGEGIKIHEFSSDTHGSIFSFGTDCVNGAIAGWLIYPDNEEVYNNAGSYSTEGLLPFPGQECTHTFHHMSFLNSTVFWSLTYEIIPITTV